MGDIIPFSSKPVPSYSHYQQRTQIALTHDSRGAVFLRDCGISDSTAKQCGIGYDGLRDCIVIPTDDGGQMLYSLTSNEIVEKNEYPSFTTALNGTQPVFLCTDWLDALAVMSAGGAAVAINSADNMRGIIDVMDGVRRLPPLIPPQELSLTPQEIAVHERLTRYLDERHAVYGREPICLENATGDGYLSPALSHKYDSKRFAGAVETAVRCARMRADPYYDPNEPTRGLTQLALAESMQLSMYYADDLNELSRGLRLIPTGFSHLDAQLGGGLYPGVFVIGGSTGEGKTTFAENIADNIAMPTDDQPGQPVLYIALEMSRRELVARSLARYTDTYAMETGDTRLSFGAIMRGKTTPSLGHGAMKYLQATKNLYIATGLGDIGARDIRKRAEAIYMARGTYPTIIVDYLQNMAKPEVHLSEKESIDYNIKALKRLSRDLDTPVIVLSSFNRTATKGKEVSNESYKGSGDIEFTADCTIGLACTGCATETGVPMRYVEGKIMKNRQGERDVLLKFTFYPTLGTFVERTGRASEHTQKPF